MPPASLNRRLISTSALAAAVFMGLAGLGLDSAFRASVERSAEAQLRLHVLSLIGRAEERSGGMDMTGVPIDGALEQPASGLYAIVRRRDGSLAWQSGSLIGTEPLVDWPRARPGRALFDALESPGHGPLYRYSYGVVWERADQSVQAYEFTALAARAPFLAEVAAFQRSLLAGLGGAAAVLLLIQAGLMVWAIRPVRALAHAVVELESGRRPVIGAQWPRELVPLARNLDDLVAHERDSRDRYRRALDDLAHALKTPLAVLRSASGADRREPDDHGLVRDQIDRMEEVIAHQLGRSMPAPARLRAGPMPVQPTVARLAAALQRLHRDRALTIANRVPEAFQWRIDERDLLEVLGNVLENACKYGHGRVEVATDGADLVIEDDGPGIADGVREAVLARGVRADTRRPGHGLGLAAAAEIMAGYGGAVRIESGVQLPGARVRLVGAAISA